MEMLSEKYGWTPTQIREQSIDDILNYIDIISVKNKIEKENNKKYKR
jgi:hypothetical protein